MCQISTSNEPFSKFEIKMSITPKRFNIFSRLFFLPLEGTLLIMYTKEFLIIIKYGKMTDEIRHHEKLLFLQY